MIKEAPVRLFDLVMCLSSAIDLVSRVLVNHHPRVAYISSVLGLLLALMVFDSRVLQLLIGLDRGCAASAMAGLAGEIEGDLRDRLFAIGGEL